MSHPVAQWLDSISHMRHDGWCFNGLYLERGKTRGIRIPLLDAAQADMLALEPWQQHKVPGFFSKLTTLELQRGQRVLEPAAVIRQLFPKLRITNGHAIYRYDVGGVTYLIPALFFISRLFLNDPVSAGYLLQPGMLESAIDPAPMRDDQSITLRLPPYLYASRCSLARAKLSAWLAIDRSARTAWSHVWLSATKGLIDTALPQVAMTGRVGGVMVADLRLVSWSRDLTFHLGLPNNIVVVGKAGRRRTFATR